MRIRSILYEVLHSSSVCSFYMFAVWMFYYHTTALMWKKCFFVYAIPGHLLQLLTTCSILLTLLQSHESDQVKQDSCVSHETNSCKSATVRITHRLSTEASFSVYDMPRYLLKSLVKKCKRWIQFLQRTLSWFSTYNLHNWHMPFPHKT
jgi:hypothetical protein